MRTVLALVMMLFCASASAAELVVVNDTPTYPRGTILNDGATVTIAAGTSLKLIDISGKGTTISGPYTGEVHASTNGDDFSILEALKFIIGPQNMVVVRSFTDRSETENPPSLYDLVNSHDEFTQCWAPHRPVQFWHSSPHRSTFFLTRQSNGDYATMNWPSNQTILPWPAAITVIDSEIYQVAFQGEIASRFTMRAVDFHEPDVATAKHLAELGCHRQALLMLETIATSKKP